MYQCSNCNSIEYSEKLVKKFFEIDSEVIIVENLPAKVCNKCGEESFSRETLVHLQGIIYGKPKKIVTAKSYEYA